MSQLSTRPAPARKHPLLFVLILLVVAVLAGVATYTVLRLAIVSTKPVDGTRSTLPAPATPSEVEQLAVAEVIRYATSQLPSIDSTANPIVPHRKMPAPYNFYAAGISKQGLYVTSKKITDVTQATAITKLLHNYFITDQKATAETLIGDSTAMSISTTVTATNYYRFTTASYTCGLQESNTTSQGGAIDGATIAVTCSTYTTYQANAEVQKPFYAAYTSSQDATPDTMLGLPTTKPSTTAGYMTAQLPLSNDSNMVGSAIGLFYQTPDKTWHFFTGTQQALSCTSYNTTDLKKAYAGETCLGTANKTLTV